MFTYVRNDGHNFILDNKKTDSGFVILGQYDVELRLRDIVLKSEPVLGNDTASIYVAYFNKECDLINASNICTFDGTRSFPQEANITSNKDGNTYVSIRFSGTLTLAWCKQLDSSDGNVLFGRLVENTFMWYHQMSGVLSQSLSIETNKSDNLFLSGSFDGELTIGGIVIYTSQYTNSFVVNYKQNGDIGWKIRTTGNGSTRINDIHRFESNSFVTVGTFDDYFTIGCDQLCPPKNNVTFSWVMIIYDDGIVNKIKVIHPDIYTDYCLDDRPSITLTTVVTSSHDIYVAGIVSVSNDSMKIIVSKLNRKLHKKWRRMIKYGARLLNLRQTVNLSYNYHILYVTHYAVYPSLYLDEKGNVAQKSSQSGVVDLRIGKISEYGEWMDNDLVCGVFNYHVDILSTNNSYAFITGNQAVNENNTNSIIGKL